PDAMHAKIVSQFPGELDDTADSFKRVIGVHQEDGRRKAANETSKGFHLALERLYVAVRHRSRTWNSIQLPSQHVGCRIHAGYVIGASGLHACIGSVHSP